MKHKVIAVLAFCLALAPALLAAQGYPAKPIRFVVPFPAGGGGDLLMRPLAQRMSATLGQPIIIDNRPGANGNIGGEIVAKSPPDGYSFLFGNSSLSISASMYTKLPFDVVKGFTPIGKVSVSPSVVVVHPSVPARTVKSLIALAKANPGKLNFASGGVGSTNHLAGELFNSMAGVKMVHVPYKGSAPAATDLIGGQIEVMFSVIPQVISNVRAGQLAAIAVTTMKRTTSMPEVPSIDESGLRGYESITWYGVLGPAGLDPEIVRKVSAAMVAALNAPELRQQLVSLGTEPESSTPEQFGAYMREDIDKRAKIIRIAGIKPE